MLLSLTAAAPAVAQTRLPAPTGITSFGDATVWSRYSPKTERFRMMLRRGGRTVTLPVRSRRVPFDADLGPGPDGRLAIVYSRCRREPRRLGPNMTSPLPAYAFGRDCDVHRYDVRRRTERKVPGASRPAVSEMLPTIWGRTVAFARGSRTGTGAVHVTGTTGASSRRLRGGTVPGGPHGGPGPTALDLRGHRLVFAWGVHLERCTPEDRLDPQFPSSMMLSQVWTQDVRSRRIALVESTCSPDRVQTFRSPHWIGGTVQYAGTTPGYDPEVVLRRHIPATGGYQEARATPDRYTTVMAVAGPVDVRHGAQLVTFAYDSGGNQVVRLTPAAPVFAESARVATRAPGLNRPS